MEHLSEIEDADSREGVHAFQTQMEIVVLSLLDHDRDTALTQIAEARTISLNHIRSLGFTPLSVAIATKAGRVAVALLEHSFERLRTVIEAPDDGPSIKDVH